MNVMVDHKLIMGQEHHVAMKKHGIILKSLEKNVASMK